MGEWGRYCAERPPTFGIDGDPVIGITAGGDGALRSAAEGAEDYFDKDRADRGAYGLTERDSMVGITVAGSAAYVIGALTASDVGAFTVGLTCNEGSKIDRRYDKAGLRI